MIQMKPWRAIAAGTLAALGLPSAAQASLGLDRVIVEMGGSEAARDDIELFNSGTERLYVMAEPARIDSPGLPGEQRVESIDPSVSGLLVAPQKLIIEPGERQLMRIAYVGGERGRENIFRVAIKPVAGTVTANANALKVFIGYDVLVIVRPAEIVSRLESRRTNNSISFHNAGNSNAELGEGRECDESGKACTELPSMRLYAGADWSVPVRPGTKVRYLVTQGGAREVREF